MIGTKLSMLALAFAVSTITMPARASTPLAPELDFPLAKKSGERKVVLAGGCFWGMQSVYQHVKGVTDVTAGFTGGSSANAHYDIVTTGTTDHVESVQVTYDPSKITLGKLLQVFFYVAHDPTEVDRQGPDVGKQYRSELFFKDAGQKKVEASYIARLNKAKVFDAPIATVLKSSTRFYAASGYHQNYVERHPDSSYVIYNDLPKIVALQRMFPEIYREHP